MSYWKTKVLPKLRKYFDRPAKKKAAAEACKSFEASKEAIEKEFEKRRHELKPKVIQIFKSSNEETQVIVKKPTDDGIKKHPQLVQKFLEELAEADLPGAQHVSDASAKYGPLSLLVPVRFVIEKASVLIIEEEAPAEKIVAKESDEKVQTLVVPESNDVAEQTVVVDEKAGNVAVVDNAERAEETTEDDVKTVVTGEVTKAVVVA